MAKSTLNSKTINELIELVDENKQPIARALSKEILFLQKTLNRLKKEIDSGDVIELFEQGKQSFLRENPAIKAYNATTSKYNQTIKQFMDMIPEGKQEESDDFDRFAKSK